MKHYAKSYLTWERRYGGGWEVCESDSPYYDEDFDTEDEARAAYDSIRMDEVMDPVQRNLMRCGDVRDVRFVKERGTYDDDTWTLDVIEHEEVQQQ